MLLPPPSHLNYFLSVLLRIRTPPFPTIYSAVSCCLVICPSSYLKNLPCYELNKIYIPHRLLILNSLGIFTVASHCLATHFSPPTHTELSEDIYFLWRQSSPHWCCSSFSSKNNIWFLFSICYNKLIRNSSSSIASVKSCTVHKEMPDMQIPIMSN